LTTPPGPLLVAANVLQCCAIDYIQHLLDSTTATLNSNQYFDSRYDMPIGLSGDGCAKIFYGVGSSLLRACASGYR